MSQIVKQAAIMALLSRSVEAVKLQDQHYTGMGNEIQLQYNAQQVADFKKEGPSMVKQNFDNADALTHENVFQAANQLEKQGSTNPVDQEELAQQRADKAADEMLAEQDFGGKRHGVHYFNMNEVDVLSKGEP